MVDAQPIYPLIYPIPYFQSRHFVSLSERPVAFTPFDSSKATVYSNTPIFYNRLFAEFDRMQFERCGKLLGEYYATSHGLILIGEAGNCFTINFPWDSSMLSRFPFAEVNTPQFWEQREKLLANWQNVPFVENCTIWSHIYYDNYYHFTFELLQKARLAENSGANLVLIPEALLLCRFQRDLLSKILGDTKIIPMNGFVRVLDPVIADGWQSYEALMWLRDKTKISASPGKNKYYVRRGTRKRKANNISESQEFLSFLKRHDFKTVDFGSGELSISEQIDRVREASVIISPHGAGMTNIAYLNPPLTVIECFSKLVLSASFMQIASNLDFRYFGIISEVEDSESSMVIDVRLLDQIMEQIL